MSALTITAAVPILAAMGKGAIRAGALAAVAGVAVVAALGQAVRLQREQAFAVPQEMLFSAGSVPSGGRAVAVCGELLPYSSGQEVAHIWSGQSGELIRTLRETTHIYDIALTPRADLAITASDALRFTDLQSGRVLATVPVKKYAKLAVSPDGSLLAVVTGGGSLELRRVPDGELVRTLGVGLRTSHRPVFSPDGRAIAAGTGKGLEEWSLVTEKRRLILAGYSVTAAYSRDGRWIVVGCHQLPLEAPNVFVVDARSARVVRSVATLVDELTEPVCALAVSPDSKLLAVSIGEVGGFVQLRIYRLSDLKLLMKSDLEGDVELAFLGPDRLLVVGSLGGVGIHRVHPVG